MFRLHVEVDDSEDSPQTSPQVSIANAVRLARHGLGMLINSKNPNLQMQVLKVLSEIPIEDACYFVQQVILLELFDYYLGCMCV